MSLNGKQIKDNTILPIKLKSIGGATSSYILSTKNDEFEWIEAPQSSSSPLSDILGVGDTTDGENMFWTKSNGLWTPGESTSDIGSQSGNVYTTKEYVNSIDDKIDTTIDFTEALYIIFYADYDNMKINSISNVLNTPTVTILVNGSPYTLGTSISLGSELDISASTASVIQLKMVKN